ncbi:MAG TPA: YCF48-related protein, partial [Patescibacteria group bacterium]|nr:YCF48-related protein [Patescibacteria group bacterium]
SDTLWGVYFESASSGWIVGENGTFKKTTDGGVSWSNVSVSGLSTQHLYDIQVVGDRMVVAGDKLVILSDDGGATWTTESFVDENITFYAAYVGDESNVWVAGTDYDVYSSIYHYEVVEDAVEEEPEAVDPGLSLGESAEVEPSNLVKLTCEEGTDVNDPCRAVYYYATDGKRHAFPNEKVFLTWFEDFDDIIEVSADFMSDLTLGSNVTYHPGTKMVKFQSVHTVYAVARYGELRAIASEDVASDLYGSDWNQQIDDISDAFYGNYDFGKAIDSADDYDKEEAEDSVESLDDNF